MNDRVKIWLICIPFLLNSIRNDFVHDDIPAIVRNKDVQGQTSLRSLLFNDYWGKPMVDPTSHKSYRPLTVFSFRVNVSMFGTGPFSFHLVNIILHLFMVDRVYSFLVASKVDSKISLIASVIFGIHPVHSEAVANCVGRAEIISSHLVLSAIINREEPFVSGVYTFLAMMAKETGVMCLPILILIEIISFFRQQNGHTNNEDKTPGAATSKVIIWTGVFIMFTSLRFLILQGTMPTFKPADNPAAFAPDRFSRLSTKMYYWYMHYSFLFCPRSLSYDWAFGSITLIREIFDLRHLNIFVFFAFIFTIGTYSLLGLLPVAYKQFSVAKYYNNIDLSCYIAILLLFLPFVPCSNLLVIVGFAVAERVMYIPSIGFSILIAQGASVLWTRAESLGLKTLVNIVIWISIVMLGVKNIYRNEAWRNKENIFNSGLTVHQTNAKMFYNLGNYYFKNNEYGEAKLMFSEAIRLHPNYASAYNNLASIYEDEGDEGIKLAEKYYRLATQINKHNPKSFTNLARLLTIQNRIQEAVKVLLHVVNADANYFVATLNLAKIMNKKGHFNEAEKLYQNAILQDPTQTSEPYNAYGIFLTEHKRYEDAMTLFSRAIEIDPTFTDSMLNLGWIYFELGRVTECEKIYKQAMKINPTAEVYNKMGLLALKKGNKIEAERYHRKATTLDPYNPEFQVRQAIVLADNGDLKRAVEILEKARVLDRLCKRPNIHIWLARMYAQQEKFVLASSRLELCSENIDIDAEVLAEVKSDLGSYYNAIARNLIGSSKMDSNKNPEGSMSQGRHARERAISVVKEAIELKPGDADMRVKLAQLYLGDQQIEAGEEMLKKALKIKSNHKNALILMDKIKKGREMTKQKISNFSINK